MPSPAPGSVRLCTASTTISASSASIITFETRSSPFCRPKLQSRNPLTTTATARTPISTGEDRSAPNMEETVSVSIPA